MKIFYKIFLFLFVLSTFLIGLVALLFPAHFLILAFVLAFVLSVFLLFFMTVYVKNNYELSVFPPDDSYNLSSLFEKFKKTYSLQNVQLLKIKDIDSACFYLSSPTDSLIILSENILESFSPEDIACFLNYAFQKIKSGDALFLSSLSSFLFLFEKLFSALNYPLSFLKNKKRKRLKKNLGNSVFFEETPSSSSVKNQKSLNISGMRALFGILSLVTRGLFYKNDRRLSQFDLNDLFFKKDFEKNKSQAMSKSNNENKRNQALFLWKLDSFLSLNPPDLPSFFAPVFLVNFLTNWEEKDYIHLQPLIKNRVKKLVGSYPP